MDVLLVDDNELLQQVISRYLGELGLTVAVAGRGDEALALAGQAPPALFIVDLYLPDMDGADVLRALRALPGCAETPAIAISGLDEEDARLVMTDDVSEYLIKPVELDDLAQAVRRHVPHAQQAGAPKPNR